MVKQSNNFGFTLIELAIVLTIIGIITLAMIKGGTILWHSKEKKTAEIMDELNSAARLYEARHPMTLPAKFNHIQHSYSAVIRLEREGIISKRFLSDGVASPLNAVVRFLPYSTNLGTIYIEALGIPQRAAQFIDEYKDDGIYNSGNCKATSSYITDPNDPNYNKLVNIRCKY